MVTNDTIDRLAGMAQQAYPNAQPAALVAERLLGPRQITDAYLLALTVHHGGCFASFDQRINLDAVPGACAGNLCIIDCAWPLVSADQASSQRVCSVQGQPSSSQNEPSTRRRC